MFNRVSKILGRFSRAISGWVVCSCWIVACHGFIIKDISIKGLHKIHKSTVMENLTVKPGDEFNRTTSTNVIRELYKTKFFDQINLSQKGRTLVIIVTERPVISAIHFHGNEDVGRDAFSGALKSAGLIKGRMFDKASLEMIEQSLKTQYAVRGKRGVVVETEVEKMSRNRVNIEINIDEGSDNQIRHIRIIGNKNISNKKLLSELPITVPGLFTYFTKTDKYSEEKINQTLEAILHLYQDRGYAKVEILSHNVGKDPSRNHVRVVIKISEGDKYTIKGYQFAGNLVVAKAILDKHVTLEKGDQYSRKVLTKIVESLSEELNDKGYTFSVVDIQPEFDEAKKEIFINFYINPGRPFYVRRIVFVGNHKTADFVLRREFLQEEGALLSTSKVQESLRKIRNLLYMQNAQINQQQVIGTNNQVDLIITVSEGNIAEFQGNAGISTNGIEYRLGINHHNVYGSGKSAGVNFKNDSWGHNLSFSYYNPYYTDSGIGRSFSAFYNRSKPGKGNFTSNIKFSSYTMDSTGGSMGFSIPVSTHNSLNVGITLKRNKVIKIGRGNTKLSSQFQSYINTFGNEFWQFNINAGWSFSNYDQFPFPTSGAELSIGGTMNYPITKYGRYYKIGADARFYQPLTIGLVLGISVSAKYLGSYSKNEVVPFFEYYKAGGVNYEGQVRGFDTASLGPRDESNDPMGGNFLISGTVAIIFPEPLSGKSFRSSIFFDVGNVYQTPNEYKRAKEKVFLGKISAGDVRNSIGVGVEWRTPFGPIRLSFAYALNAKKGDDTSIPALSFMSGF